MQKPHIYFSKTWGDWLCASQLFVAWGPTPRMAWQRWNLRDLECGSTHNAPTRLQVRRIKETPRKAG